MNFTTVLQYGLFLVVAWLLVKPLGDYLARVFAGERTWLDPLLRPLERAVYKLARVDAQQEMSWQQYAGSFVLFGLVTLRAFCVSSDHQHWLRDSRLILMR